MGAGTQCSGMMLRLQRDWLQVNPPYGSGDGSSEGAGYAWTQGNFRFVMMNLNPYLNVDVLVPESRLLGEGLPWFQAILASAKSNNQKVIVFIHHLTGIESLGARNLATDTDFSSAIRDGPVSMIFVGHIHSYFGYAGQLEGVPVVYSGAVEFLSYLDVAYADDKIRISARVQDTNPYEIGNWVYNLGANGKPTNPSAGLSWNFDNSIRSLQIPLSGSIYI
jgi:3',5'-cyclic AMP phosphodiesterase CpdA